MDDAKSDDGEGVTWAWASASEVAASIGAALGGDAVVPESVLDAYVAAGSLRKRIRPDGTAEYAPSEEVLAAERERSDG